MTRHGEPTDGSISLKMQTTMYCPNETLVLHSLEDMRALTASHVLEWLSFGSNTRFSQGSLPHLFPSQILCVMGGLAGVFQEGVLISRKRECPFNNQVVLFGQVNSRGLVGGTYFRKCLRIQSIP